MSEINIKLGKKIRSLRLKKGISQEYLAFESDLSRAYIGRIERGEKNIGLKNLEKISIALGITLKDLFESL